MPVAGCIVSERANSADIAAAIGLGLRSPHLRHVESTRPAIGWLEIHAENYLYGPPLTRLIALRADYPLSVHGVGLSLGTASGLDPEHLKRFKALIERTEPFLVSEHLSWSVADGVYLGDLLPLPYTEESLDIVAANVDAAQDAIGRRILVENPSRYLQLRHSTIPEPDFLAALARRTGCGVLLDVNNVFVTCSNLDLDAQAYLEALSDTPIGEIHLAGHSRVRRGEHTILIDDHASTVSEPVWRLYANALERFGLVPSLIEWDKDLPSFDTLAAEAQKAARMVQNWSSKNACAA
jgi:uncharacterized protein (UPF0276 family)